jgi:hypothetical protein
MYLMLHTAINVVLASVYVNTSFCLKDITASKTSLQNKKKNECSAGANQPRPPAGTL